MTKSNVVQWEIESNNVVRCKKTGDPRPMFTISYLWIMPQNISQQCMTTWCRCHYHGLAMSVEQWACYILMPIGNCRPPTHSSKTIAITITIINIIVTSCNILLQKFAMFNNKLLLFGVFCLLQFVVHLQCIARLLSFYTLSPHDRVEYKISAI